jgi:site-specific recombinase
MADGTTDLDLLPQHFRLLAGEVRSIAETINHKVVPALTRIVERLDEDNHDIVQLKRETAQLRSEAAATRDRVDEAHVELLALAGAR